MAETNPTSLLEMGKAKSKKVAEQRKNTTATQPTSGQPTATATQPYVYEAKTSRRSIGLTPADQQKAIDKVTPKPRAQAEQPQVRRDATNYTPAVKQRQPIQTPLEKKKEESQANATPIKIKEAETLGIDKYNYDMALPQEFVDDFGRGGIDKLFKHVDMSQDDDYNESLLQAAIKYVNATYPNEGVIEFNGKKYDKGSLAMSLVPLMRERGHHYLMRGNAKYRDDWAAEQGFGNFNVWLAAQDSELAKLEEEISKAWKDRASDNMGWKMAARGTLGHVFPIINALPFIDRDASGVKHIRDLRDAIKLMRNGDYSAFDEFMKGAEEGFDYMNMLSFGMSGLAADTMRNRVLDKAYNGEELTPDEERILNIYKKEQEIRGYDHNAGSMTRQLGNIMGYMGQELPQYIWGGKIAGGVLKTGAKYMPNVVKGVVAATRGNKAVAPLRWGLKATGDYGAGLVAAPFLPGTYERFVEKRNEQYSIEDGKLKKDPTSALKDALSVWFEQAGEIGSELTGARMADFLDSSLLSLGSEVGVYKWLNKITPAIGGVETSKALRYAKSTSHRAAQQAAQYSGGVVTEGLGEAWGSFTAEVMKEAVLGEGNFEQFKDAEFWALTFGASGLAGLGFDAPTTAMDWVDYYRDLRTLSGTKKNAISKVEHTDLKNALIALSSGGNIKESTEHLANLDWENGGYSLEEIGYAMDYIRAEAMQQVRMGEATESERLQRFGKVAQTINNITYHNEVGEATDSIISAMDKEGNTYYILEGDITNPEAMLKAMDSEGKVVSLLASNVSGYSKASVAETSQHYYREMFSTEFNMQRLESAEYAIDRMDNPTMAQVADVAKRVGIVLPKEGDTITLVDGRTAKVTSISDDLGIMAEMSDGEGNVSQVTIPIMQILSSNTYIAEAQKLQNAEDALELAQAEEAQMEAQDIAEENAEATSGMEETTTEKVAEDGLIGTEVTLPDGNKGTIAEVDGNDVIVDTGRGVDAYEVYSKEELGMTEAAETTTPQPTQTTAEQTTGEVTPEQATEALNEIADIKPVPTLEDGSIDYDAIDDAETFAKHFEHDMGGREEAIEDVKEMREQAMADLAEAEKKGKKARSANDKVANKKLREQLAERIAFYDNVLDVYSQKAEAAAPTESVAEADTTSSTAEVAEVAETTPQTMKAETMATPQEAETRTEAAETTEEVAEEEALSAEEIWAAERREGYAVPDQNGQLVGLVHNELSEQLEKSVRIFLNDVATAFGISIVFQREVRSNAGNLVNGKIEGTTVYFSWGSRKHTLTWLMGHEFTHRMKSLAPEAYNKLRDAVRAYLGDEKWNQRIEEQRKIYEERENPEEILSFAEREAIGEEAWEQTKREDGSYNEEAAKKLYNEKMAEARREAYIEEVVCDEVGVLARDHKAFDRFLRSEHVRNDGKFLRWLRKVWQSIKSAFSHDARTFNEVMKTLDELINVSTAEVAKGVEPTKGGENNSLVAEATERIESNGGVVDTQRGDVKYALSDVLTVPERESAIQDLMRVTGRSRATVQKYLKAEQSLARIIADDDNRAFLDLQVDESVPSIWNNSDYPQGTVEFSNICRKRLPLTMIYQQLQKEFPNTVFDASTLETIRGVLKENGVDVACGLCFVEDRRQLLGEIGKGFISALKGENVDVNEKQKEAIASLKDSYIPNLYELLTLDGMKALKKTHPEVANAFVAYNNARGMQAGRLFQAYSAYHREILGYSKARVNKINASGGLRIFSFSDFEAHHLIDLVQVLTDCARKGIKVQGYTKVPEFARAVKDTGMKLNRSLIAKGDGYVDADYTPKKNEAVSPNVVDGKRLLLDCVEGIDVNHKDFFDSSSSHNVGNILVGINDEQIRLAMVDPFVDYIIPFHSGLSEAIRKQKGIGNWQNYKLEQLEKKDNGSGKLVNADKHGVNIYTEVLNEDIKTEKQFVERYLEVCKEKGWIPKFHRFLKKNKNGDFVYTKGYYKLLLDFKMFDSKGRILPQEVVQPIFDDAFNKEILEDYVKGEKAKMPNDEVYNKVKEALNLGGAKYSLATDVASILEEYDTEGVKYGSILDVADGIESLIAESTEDTTELENILDDFRATQDDTRRWGNRMDSGGEEEFEEALRAYASQPKYSLQTINALSDALSEYNMNGDIASFVDAVSAENARFGGHEYLTNLIMDYEEDGDAKWFAERVKHIVGGENKGYAPYTAGGVKYSLSSSNKSAIRYDKENGTNVKEFFDFLRNGKVFEDGKPDLFHIANAGELLQRYGIKGKFMVGRFTFSRTHTDNEDHNLGLKEWVDVINNINNPLAIASYKGQPNQFRIYTYATINGKNICVGVNVSLKDNSIELSNIISAYGRDINSLLGKEGVNLLYPNSIEELKQRISQVSTAHNSLLNATSSASANKDTTSNAENQTNGGKYSLITPEMDATYLDAVGRGDMATAQKMVMEAAKLAMPNTKVVDEDGNPKVVYHQTNHSVYINRETGQNWDELDWRERMEWDERDDWDDYWEEREFNTFSRVNARTTQELDGFFFAPEYDEYHEYGDRTISAFLNITNPASFGDYNIDSSKTNAGRDERIRLQNEGYDGVINEEDGAIWEYIAFEPNQIKSADPVTYDDAGNVIPLSERFNPEKEDIRYSLIGEMGASNIESYGRYGSPAYALEQARDMEADGKSVKEIRVATNWERGKDGKWRYEINDGVYTDPEDKDKEYKLSDILKNDALYEAYPKLADMPVYYAELEGNKRGMYDGEAIWLRKTLDEQQAHSTLVHEMQHAIQHREGFARGGNKGMFEQEAIEKLEQTLGGLEKEKDKFRSYNKLRKAYLILKYVANSLRLDRAESKAYEQYRRLAGEVEARNVQARMNMSEEERLLIPIGSTEDVARSSQNVIQRELMAADGARYSLREESSPTRYSLQSGDIPFFNDNGDIITFDNTDITGEDYDAVELRSPKPTTPRTTEDVIKAHLSARHNTAKERIRRESRVLRDAVRKQYREEQVRRREGVESMRTNAAKVDYIIGAPIETLDYEAQVLAMIAMGTLSISWESLSKELGVKSGDKKSYRHITNGATATLDAAVHEWWKSLDGSENGIDTQDLRNALIDVLMQVPTAKGALSILEDRFDHALRNRDEALEDIDREEERLIAEEEARYKEKEQMLKDPAHMADYMRQYEQTVGFHEELTAIEGTLRKMGSELKAVRKRAERAQIRSRASKQKQSASFKEVREAIAEGKRALLEALSTYEQLGFNKQEVRSLVDAVNKARSMADINKVRVKIENVILNVSIREKRRHMDQMLNLRLPSGELVETWVSKQIHDGKMSVADGKRILADMFRGTNANGVRVAKYVDDETARVMDYLRKNLIVPNHGAHYEEKKDVDGNVIGREYVPSREAEMGADTLMQANNERCNELLGKAVEGTITEEEKIELQARQLYEPYLFVANARAYVKEVRAEGEKMYEDIQRKKAELGDAYTKEERDADYAALEANALHLVEAKTAYDDALTEYNETLSNVIMSGRDKLREFREAKEAHKTKVVNMAIRAIGGEARTIASQPTVAEKIAAWNRTAFHSTYWSFDSVCREIDRFAPNGEGEFYKHFMGGWREASNNFFTRTENHVLSICEAVGRITGSGKDSRRALQAFIRKADMATVGTITYKNDNGKVETMPLRVSNALFILAMWEQSQYREIMEKRGISEEQIESLKTKIASIDEHYLDFKDWVVQEFLPSTRLEYNEVHKQVFGASMDNIPNYFPAKVVEGYREADIANNESGLPSTMTGSIITRQKHNNMPDFGQSFFSVLLNHLQNMDQWASFTPLVEDMNAVLSNPEFKRLANAHMSGKNNDRSGKGSLWQIFKDTSAVAIGSFRCESNVADDIVKFLTGSWAASNITWRFSTALKQLSGLTAVAFSGFGKTQTMWVKNMALCPMALKWAMENSPMLQKRFGDRFAGNEALMQQYGQKQAKGLDLDKGKLKNGLERVNDFIRFLTVDVGMTPNAAVDALVVAVTMKTVYDVELSNLTKGKPETATEEQKKYAMMKAEIFANETQQSGEGAYMSVPQAQRSVITAALTTYLNASFASHRLRVQGVQDIYRWMSPKYRNEMNDRYGKGAARKAAGKGFARLLAGLSIDATFILMSRAVGQGLWRLIIDWFDDTEDNDDEEDPIDWSDIGKEIGLNVAFGGLLGGTIVTTLGNGFTFTPIPALDELKKDVFKALGWTDKKIKDGDYSIDLSLWALGEIIFKYGYGLDPETILNMARGIEGICRDKDPMAAMKLLNTPQTMINIIAGPRRDNETVKEYVERRARLEVLFAQPKYSELYNDEGKFIGKGKYDVVGGAKDYRLKSLFKEYNERQRAIVMSKYLSPSEVAEFERIDREYKAIVEPLGWEVGNNPQDDKVDKTGWRNIYPEGLRQEHYAALKGIATAAEQTRRAQDRWVGSDQGYADLVREEYNLREQLIAGRRSSYKAKTAKEKIDKIEREKKANKKNKSQKK